MDNAVIFDIDGTIADLSHRLHHIQGDKKDWNAFHADVDKDSPIYHIMDIIDALELMNKHTIILCTGRMERCREATEYWLEQYGVGYHRLLMRPEGNYEPDYAVKKTMLEELKSIGFEIQMVFEDRTQVVNMWREAGIPCLQVKEGDY